MGDWRIETIAKVRRLIKEAEPDVVEEVKWKKPSNPAGVAVWSHDGIVGHADVLKNTVRLNFHKGAQMKENKLFNTRLDSTTVRAIDYREDDPVDAEAIKALILEAVELNKAKARK